VEQRGWRGEEAEAFRELGPRALPLLRDLCLRRDEKPSAGVSKTAFPLLVIAALGGMLAYDIYGPTLGLW